MCICWFLLHMCVCDSGQCTKRKVHQCVFTSLLPQSIVSVLLATLSVADTVQRLSATGEWVWCIAGMVLTAGAKLLAVKPTGSLSLAHDQPPHGLAWHAMPFANVRLWRSAVWVGARVGIPCARCSFVPAYVVQLIFRTVLSSILATNPNTHNLLILIAIAY